MKQKLNIKKITIISAIVASLLVACFAGVTQLKKAGFFNTAVQSAEDEKPLTLKEIATGTPTGENPLKEVEKILKAYEKQNAFSFSGEVKLYEEVGEEDKVTETKQISFQKQGNRTYYSIGTMDYITEENQLLMIDHESKQMQFSPLENTNYDIAEAAQLEQIKKYLTADSAEAIVSATETEKIITIINPLDPAVQQYTIHYTKDNYRVTRVSMVMYRTEEMDEEDHKETEEMRKIREEEREKNSGDSTILPEELGYKQMYYEVEFIYRGFSETVVWEPKHSISNYIHKTGSEFEVNEPYKNYELNY